ncbi:amidase domain-containing protein [Alkaliphilus hydrothermalis]|uniref:Putative amidase domain-containing protein n=1 Tax=Alkaliphilus hydrothermalis TaxID=1482730 RepID=A0ABS2NS26_9FIRM|nr:amidase domain-containing protein [Alkaliphilus hydrothermalis]MBM7615716.1 hypothetical protein [Alkaliphilus hydrothermalis]
MIILMSIKKLVRILVTLIAILLAIFLSFSWYFNWFSSHEMAAVFSSEEINLMLTEEIHQLLHLRNQTLLEKNTAALSSLYNQKLRNGVWAYEHELKKMKYLHKWSEKQAVTFKDIDSDVIVRYSKPKGEGFTVGLLVSTEYQYSYNDTPEVTDIFRIGTYHTLDLIPNGDSWVITKEWYADPFADSLHLDEMTTEVMKKIITSGQPKDLSDLNERRVKALEYIDQYCGAASLPEFGFKYNPKYGNFNAQGGNCANFASQMLFEGGGFRKNRTWNYEKGEGSKAWLNANAFNDYMLNSGRASRIAYGSYDQILKASFKLLPGDYVAYEKKGKVTHISVVSGQDSKGYALVNSHNSDRYRVPWDLGWNNKGIKFHLVRVHY